MPLMTTPTKKCHISLQTKYVGEQFLDYTSNQVRIMEACIVSDVLFEYRFSFANVNAAKISLQVNNVLDHDYSSNGNI
jgi:iron complex outermembrane receptor protein